MPSLADAKLHLGWLREHATSLRRDFAGGLASAIPGFVYALTLGLVVYAPVGEAHVELGMRAGFAAAVFGAVAAALFSGTTVATSGPRASVTLVLAGFVLQLARDPALTIEHVSALAASCVFLAGIMQIVFGALRAGAIAKFVPYPVVAGFMCGIAALIVLSQLPALGIDFGGAGTQAGGQIDLLPLAVGLATAIAIWTIGRHRGLSGALLLGMLMGFLVHYVFAAAAGAKAAGPLVGELPAIFAWPAGYDHYARVFADTHVQGHLAALVATAAVIAMIGSLDTLLAAVAIDSVAGTRHNANRELIAQGLGNMTSALFAGLPVALSGARGITAYRAGGRTPAAGLTGALVIGVVAFACVPLLRLVPLAVLAGVMLTIAWGLVDEWTRALARRLVAGAREPGLLWSAAIVAVVVAVTLGVNFVVAVVAGVFLSLAIFIDAMNRSLVRAVYPGNVKPSRRVYGPELSRRLDEVRRRIQVVELEGALFFGSTETLGERVESLARSAEYLVLDLSRLTAIDVTGAITLQRVMRRIVGRGASILFVGLKKHQAALRAAGRLERVEAAPWFSDADQALEHAERALLGSWDPPSEVALARLALARGLDETELDALRRVLTRLSMRAGETLFREGESGDTLYLLAAGAVTIAIASMTGSSRRLITYAPGAMFGEMAMLDGRARSATALVVEDSVLYALSRADLDVLAAASPGTAVKLLTNLARDLSINLRGTTDTLRDLWDVRG